MEEAASLSEKYGIDPLFSVKIDPITETFATWTGDWYSPETYFIIDYVDPWISDWHQDAYIGVLPVRTVD